VLDDGTGLHLIYITGKIPQGVSPTRPLGERLLVEGKLALDADKKDIHGSDADKHAAPGKAKDDLRVGNWSDG
jgi:hypothetical protein